MRGQWFELSALMSEQNVEEVIRYLTDRGFTFTITECTEGLDLEEMPDELFSVDGIGEADLRALPDEIFSVEDETDEADLEELPHEFSVDDGIEEVDAGVAQDRSGTPQGANHSKRCSRASPARTLCGRGGPRP